MLSFSVFDIFICKKRKEAIIIILQEYSILYCNTPLFNPPLISNCFRVGKKPSSLEICVMLEHVRCVYKLSKNTFITEYKKVELARVCTITLYIVLLKHNHHNKNLNFILRYTHNSKLCVC